MTCLFVSRDKENRLNSLCWCFPGSTYSMCPKPSLGNQDSASLRGKLDWTGLLRNTPKATETECTESRDFCDCDCEYQPQAGNRCDFLHTLKQKHCDLKLRISIASDCDFILRISSGNRALSARNFPAN